MFDNITDSRWNKMRILKSLLILFSVVAVISSCNPNTPTVKSTDITSDSPTALSTTDVIFTLTPKPAYTPTVTPTGTPTSTPVNTPTAMVSKTRINISPELYLDENSSRDNLRGKLYFPDQYRFSHVPKDEGTGYGTVYHLGDEEWVVALTWTRLFPFDGNLSSNEIELRQHYIQIWKDKFIIHWFPVEDISYKEESLVSYDGHWAFWFTNLDTNQGHIIQDGVLLNDLHGYNHAFGLFLMGGKPFFFFQRGDQIGISFNNKEILLPYSHIIYHQVCCESTGNNNPRATDIMVGFSAQTKDGYKYIEIGLR
jgi:hypothetical protein